MTKPDKAQLRKADRVAAAALNQLKAATTLSARLLAATAAMGVIATIVGSDNIEGLRQLALTYPNLVNFLNQFYTLLTFHPWLAAIVTTLGSDLLANIIDRIAFDTQPSDERIQQTLLTALRGTEAEAHIIDLSYEGTATALEDYRPLTEQEFYRALARWLRRDEEQYQTTIVLLNNILQEVKTLQKGLPPPAPPVQLPPPATHFTGRASDLDWLTTRLQLGRTLTIWGSGGMGKTALVAEALHRLSEQGELARRFPYGVIFYSFYGRSDMPLAYDHIVRSLDPEARDVTPDAVQRLLAVSPVLLILDGTEEAADIPALLRLASQCAVLITSRRRADSSEERLELEPLPDYDALSLLNTWSGEDVGEESGRALIEMVGRLPLAVRLIGRYLDQSGDTAAEYLEALKQTPIRELSQGEHREDSVAVLLDRSVAQVSETAQAALRAVGALEMAPFDVAPIAAALGLDTRPAQRALGELVNYGLLLRDTDGRYTAGHALVHTYVNRRLLPVKDALTRLVDWYVTVFRELSGSADGIAALHDKQDHLLRLQETAFSRQAWQGVQDLAYASDKYFTLSGRAIQWSTILNRALEAARISGDRQGEGSHLNYLGWAYTALGEPRRAIAFYEQALVTFREVGNRRRAGVVLSNLGGTYAAQGELQRAITCFEEALVIVREVGHRQGEGAVLGNLGLAYADLGELRQAIAFYEQALIIQREIVDRRNEGNQLGNLGLAHVYLGEPRRAISYCEQALAIRREIGDRRGEGNDLGNLGLAYADLGEPQRAITFYEQALDIAREIGTQLNEGNQLGNLGLAYADLGETRRAFVFHQQALTIAQKLGFRGLEGNELRYLGLVYVDMGEQQRAIAFYEQALIIHREIGDRRGEEIDLGNLGLTYADLGELQRAIAFYEQALDIADEIGDILNAVRHSWNLGLVYEKEDPVRAAELMTPRVAYYQELGHADAEKYAEKLKAVQARIAEYGSVANGKLKQCSLPDSKILCNGTP